MAPRTRQVIPLLALALCLAAPALAAPPVPLTVTPVSARIRVDSTCSTAGVSAASLNTSVTSTPGMTAQLQIDASVSGSQGLVTLTGNGSGDAGTVYIDVFLEVDVQVPQIGDAMTPVLVSLGTLAATGPVWSIRYVGVYGSRLAVVPDCDTAEAAAPSSSFLGSPLGDAFDPYAIFGGNLEPGGRVTHPVLLLAGDTARIPLHVYIQLSHDAGPGTVNGTVQVLFRTSPTTIGTGDVNGDAQVNVLDTTLIRRAIAGFPNP